MEGRTAATGQQAGQPQQAPQAGHDELSAMACGAILCWLTGDTYAVMRIEEEIERLRFTPEQVSTTFGVMAGKMLVEAAGTRANAIIVADRVSPSGQRP